ncbi:two-component system, chemotaxis family, response regulator CheY [Tindallia magadiensis]|uniref:Stage 0 sporulation protein A homolog n=1 Tax=Tindallia magadiensis TaxID=69895 RepID=A0A1I3GA92_9FIRM|nr:response regulator [Tindallia magadiensis]SFI20091.1 two-component system, chemotaxis family, response regulator CheY [Tindallia magadiensis]
MKILIAEDHHPSSYVLKKFLEAYGECTLVENGMDAVNSFLQSLKEGEGFDLICLDILMPKMDGLKTLQSIRKIQEKMENENQKEPRIIMVTALEETDNIYKAFEDGCDAYLVKPYTKEKLEATLKKLDIFPKESK